MKTTELVTLTRPAMISTLVEIGLGLSETKALLAKLQARMLCGQVAEHAARHQINRARGAHHHGEEMWCWRSTIGDALALFP